MTEEQLTALSEEPKEFLGKCRYYERQIRLKRDEIRRYHDLAISITQEIKEITTFSLTPSHKVENACLEVMALQEEIQKDIADLVSARYAIIEAIDLLPDDTQRLLLEARYINEMTWEQITLLIPCSYRWALRLHGLALKNLSEIAKEKLERSHVNSH